MSEIELRFLVGLRVVAGDYKNQAHPSTMAHNVFQVPVHSHSPTTSPRKNCQRWIMMFSMDAKMIKEKVKGIRKMVLGSFIACQRCYTPVAPGEPCWNCGTMNWRWYNLSLKAWLTSSICQRADVIDSSGLLEWHNFGFESVGRFIGIQI